MAKPIEFEEQNRVYKAEGCGDLPALVASKNEIVSCWELTKEELEEINKTGKIWLICVGSQPPVSVEGFKPFGENNINQEKTLILCDFKAYVDELQIRYPEKKELSQLSLELSFLFFDLEHTTFEAIKDLQERYNLDGFRFCTKCGKFIRSGYLTTDMEPYCSLECLEMTEKEIEGQYSDDKNCIVWTDWED